MKFPFVSALVAARRCWRGATQAKWLQMSDRFAAERRVEARDSYVMETVGDTLTLPAVSISLERHSRVKKRRQKLSGDRLW